MTFVIGSYRAVEHPGGGHRASAWALWRGEDLRTADEVAMTALAAECGADAALAVEVARPIRHAHLLPVVEVVEDEVRAVLVCPWPRGGRLLELLTRRGRLSVGETLTVLLPLAGALAAVHAAGVRHGGVCPEGIWLHGDGRPMLGAVAVSRAVADQNAGLPAVSRDVAPEVVRGEGSGGQLVGTAADVFSLGSVALRCLTGRPAWPADDPADVLVQSAAGLWPDLDDDAGPFELVTVVRQMLSDDPAQRPTAAELIERLAGAGEAAPIRFESGPAPVPASATRWRGWAGQAVEGQGAVAVGEVERGDPVREKERPVLAQDESVVTPVSGPTGRTRAARSGGSADAGRRTTPLTRLGIAVLSALLVTLVLVQVAGWWGGWDDPLADAGGQTSEVLEPPAGADGPDWPAVVAALDAARGRAFAAADPALLREVYLDGSAAGQVDAITIGRLAAQGWRVPDSAHLISSVTVDGPADPADGASVEPAAAGPVRLVVVDSLPSHPIVDAAGRQVGLTPARTQESRVLVVTASAEGYRIGEVVPG